MPPSVFREYSGVKIYTCCLYDDLIKNLIKDLKYHNRKKLAKVAAKVMSDYIKELNFKEDFVLLPVPVSKLRLKERKYNHMDIVADELASLFGYKTVKNLLVRIKDTEKQYKLHKQERIKNIRNAFEINEKADIPKDTHFLLIDDITSTGITFEEIIKTLKKGGYENITAIALSTPDIWN